MKMTTVKMLRGQSGTFPGWRSGQYLVRADGNPVDVPSDLAAVWIRKGYAEEVRPSRQRRETAAPSGDSAAQPSSSESTTQEVNDD